MKIIHCADLHLDSKMTSNLSKEQAKERKRQNDLKKIEAEIERLEARSEELDVLLADEAVYTNHTKLLEVTKEKDETAERLLELMEQWETLAD